MLPHRRHRKKSSSKPEAQGRNQPLVKDTLLPTTYSSTYYYDDNDTQNSRTSVTCNSFLMGGNYYPGKDKKRRHHRRRTFWYRIFFSSPWRRVVTVITVAYIVVWHGLVPLVKLGGYYLMNGNGTFSGSMVLNKPNWLQYDSTLDIPPLRDEQLGRLQVASERARLRYGSPHRNDLRMNVLERIVPDFFHRNDQKQNSKSNTREINNKAKSSSHAENVKQEQAKHHAMNTVKSGLQISQLKNEDLPYRTLHTMEQFTNHSSCPAEQHNDDFKTSLVVQTTIDRLWILNETCSRWKDPIIAVVFVPLNGNSNVPSKSIFNNCPHVQIINYMANEHESANQQYPVNRLRNVGLDAVQTSHVLMIDIDFVPSQGLDDTIRRGLKQTVTQKKNALVVPAFERLPPKPCSTENPCSKYLEESHDFIPHSFTDLQTCVKSKNCVVFQSRINWEGHYSTRSDEWLQRKWSNDETEIKTLGCFHSARYEPYVVLRWCPSSDKPHGAPIAPYYDERFHGYGKNKIEMISHLRKSGYAFSVLPEGFLVHNPHPESAIKEDWKDVKGSDLHTSMDKLYSTFMTELDTKYKDLHNNTVKLCQKKPFLT